MLCRYFTLLVAASCLLIPLTSSASTPPDETWCQFSDPATYRDNLKKFRQANPDADTSSSEEGGLDDISGLIAEGEAPEPEEEKAPAQPVEKKLCPALDMENNQTGIDELVLPLPCNQHMVFRRINMPLNDLLDDEEVYLGTMGSDGSWDKNSLTRGRFRTSLAGGFNTFSPDEERLPHRWKKLSRHWEEKERKRLESGQAQGRLSSNHRPTELHQRYYYLGKYEVTALQYYLMQPQFTGFTQAGGLEKPQDEICNSPEVQAKIKQLQTSDAQGFPDIKPQASITWFDAVTFSKNYTEWLLKYDRYRVLKDGKQKPYLPWEQGSPGFLRLPTEAEWEYAARGGLARFDDTGQLYKVPGRESISLSDIAQTRKELNAGNLVGIGGKAPNNYQLYDMVGNAEEIVFDLFRLTTPTRDLHGQSGGYVVKGGSVIDDGKMSVSFRKESPFFNEDGSIRSQKRGFRLAISVPVQVQPLPPPRRRDQLPAPWLEMSKNIDDRRTQGVNAWMEDNLALAIAKHEAEVAQTERVLTDVVTRINTLMEKSTDRNTKNALATIKDSVEKRRAELDAARERLLIEQYKNALLMLSSINSYGAVNTMYERRRKNNEKKLRTYFEKLMSSNSKPTTIADKLLKKIYLRKKKIHSSIRREKAILATFETYIQIVGGFTHTADKTLMDRSQAFHKFTAIKNKAEDQLKKREQYDVLERYNNILTEQISEAIEERGRVSETMKKKWLNRIDRTRVKRGSLNTLLDEFNETNRWEQIGSGA